MQALASRTRRRILLLAAERERSAGELAGQFPVSRPAISHHLKVLRDADLVVERRDGARRLFRTNRRTLAAVAVHVESLGRESTPDLAPAAD